MSFNLTAIEPDSFYFSKMVLHRNMYILDPKLFIKFKNLQSKQFLKQLGRNEQKQLYKLKFTKIIDKKKKQNSEEKYTLPVKHVENSNSKNKKYYKSDSKNKKDYKKRNKNNNKPYIKRKKQE